MKSVISQHPLLLTYLKNVTRTGRLGGLTNKNLLVDTLQGKFVLRVPGEGTAEYINRLSEKHAAMVTSELGVNAPVLYFDEVSGVQLCAFIENALTMNSETFRDLSAVARAARSFSKVHTSGASFKNRFELFQMIDNYLQILEGKGAKLPEGFDAVRLEAGTVRTALNRHPTPVVPCHCDPLAENFLDDGKQMFIIDWEYSGNNDPMWDLGDLCVEAGFNEEQEEALFSAYFADGKPRPFDRGRMVLHKAMCDLLWTLWGVIQHANQNPADDFWAYSLKRFERCKKLMKSSGFSRHLSAVMDGPGALPTLH